MQRCAQQFGAALRRGSVHKRDCDTACGVPKPLRPLLLLARASVTSAAPGAPAACGTPSAPLHAQLSSACEGRASLELQLCPTGARGFAAAPQRAADEHSVPRQHASGAGRSEHQPRQQHAAPAGTAAAASTAPHGRLNEPKDEPHFAGRVVQHNGSHAVHLLVAGSTAKDYHLRMVRCHVADEPHFGPTGGGHGHGHAQQFVCSTGTADPGDVRPRGEEVPFTTFMYRQLRDAVQATFLPAGYPATTGDNYLKFAGWQGVNNMAVTANSVLASTFMLYAVGLGAGSIPTAGALNWVLKDGMGQLGTLVFGKTIAHNFDVHSKTWFFLSAVLLAAAAGLEMLTVVAPSHFLLMGSAANTLKGLAWMAAGSTRSVFHLSFARDNNIADVTAKGTSQFICASLVGTAGGAAMCAGVGTSSAAAAGCYGLLAAATLASAYMAVQVIPLATLNATRLQMLVDAFLTSISPAGAAAAAAAATTAATAAASSSAAGAAAAAAAAGAPGAATPAAPAASTSQEAEDEHAFDFGPNPSSSGGGGARPRPAAGARHLASRRSDARSDFEDDGRDEDEWGYGDNEDDDDEGEYAHGAAGRTRNGSSAGRGMRGGGGALPRRRRWRGVDRCYIGPSVREYDTLYDDSLEPRVPTPLQLAPLDPPLPRLSPGTAARLAPAIHVGSRLEDVVEGSASLLVMLLTTYKYAHFMVVPARGGLHVILHERADPRDMVQAYLQACILRRRMRTHGLPLSDGDGSDVDGSGGGGTAELRLELQESLAAAERLTTIFMATLEANGWTIAKVVVEAQRRRARW